MARIAAISLFIFFTCQLWDLSTQEREVLIRDRLVMVLCDQIDQYLTTGNFPEPVKKMPEKYRKVKPGKGGRMDGYKVVSPGQKKKREAEHYMNHPILDLMYE